jgi:hypothetical protein
MLLIIAKSRIYNGVIRKSKRFKKVLKVFKDFLQADHQTLI